MNDKYVLCILVHQWPILKYEQMLRDENPGNKLFENSRPRWKLLDDLGDSVPLEIVGTISSFSKVRSLKSCPLRAHCKLPIVHLSIGFLHNPLRPLRRSQQPIGALTVVPVCVDALASAQICAVSKAGAGCLVMEYCLQSRVRCNAELVEPIWGLKMTTEQLDVGGF